MKLAVMRWWPISDKDKGTTTSKEHQHRNEIHSAHASTIRGFRFLHQYLITPTLSSRGF